MLHVYESMLNDVVRHVLRINKRKIFRSKNDQMLHHVQFTMHVPPTWRELQPPCPRLELCERVNSRVEEEDEEKEEEVFFCGVDVNGRGEAVLEEQWGSPSSPT